MFVCCERCVLSGRGLCDGLITRPEESYRLCRVIVLSRNLKNEEAKTRKWVVKASKSTTTTQGRATSSMVIRRFLTAMFQFRSQDSPRRRSRAGTGSSKYFHRHSTFIHQPASLEAIMTRNPNPRII
jgi:hypothetical protein